MSAATRYYPEDKAFVGIDLPGICNRPLFCANTPTTLLSGDRPLLRLIRYGTLLGTLRFRVQTESGPRYLDECGSIRFRYRANLTEWYIQDPALPCAVTLTAGVPEDTEGFVLRAEADSAVALQWSYGGLYTFEECHWNLTSDDPEVIGCAETPAEWYAGNRLSCSDDVFTLCADGSMEGTFVSGLGAQGGSVQRSIAGESIVYLRCSQSAAIQPDNSVGGTLKLGSKPAKQVKDLMIPDKNNVEDVKRVADLAVAKKGGKVYGDYIEKAEGIQNNYPQAAPETTIKKVPVKAVKSSLAKNG